MGFARYIIYVTAFDTSPLDQNLRAKAFHVLLSFLLSSFPSFFLPLALSLSPALFLCLGLFIFSLATWLGLFLMHRDVWRLDVEGNNALLRVFFVSLSLSPKSNMLPQRGLPILRQLVDRLFCSYVKYNTWHVFPWRTTSLIRFHAFEMIAMYCRLSGIKWRICR